jgi:hypothetical protein
MKLNERCSGRGFDSHHLHQKHIVKVFDTKAGQAGVLLMGVSWFRQGNE